MTVFFEIHFTPLLFIYLLLLVILSTVVDISLLKKSVLFMSFWFEGDLF